MSDEHGFLDSAIRLATALERAIANRKELISCLRRMIGWTTAGACPDCVMFRATPCDQEFQHAHDCGFLKTINEACALVGYPPFVGHHFDDPEGEMMRLAYERALRMPLR